MKKHLLRIIVGLCVVAAFFLHSRGNFDLLFVQKLENIASDTRLALTMPRGVDPRVIILDIDEKSLKEREQGGRGAGRGRATAWR